MDVRMSLYTAQGNRNTNEDSVLSTNKDGIILAVVADGLGGHCKGEVASNQAVESISSQLAYLLPDEDLLIEAIQEASRKIYSMQTDAQIMLTTVAVVWLRGDYAVVANVGDSRIYQFRNGKIVYQSLDHSVAQLAVLVGKLNSEDIRKSKDRNRLVRVLGAAEPPRPDCNTLDIRSGDYFLLCSDGFWEAVTEEKMLATLQESSSTEQWLMLMQRIVTLANNPLQDNHSAIALSVC